MVLVGLVVEGSFQKLVHTLNKDQQTWFIQLELKLIPEQYILVYKQNVIMMLLLLI